MTLSRKTVTAFAVLVAALSLSAASGLAPPAVATARSILAVVIIGPGSVTSSPAGISCPGKCASTFAYGTTVLLSPTPAAGSKFVRWGLPCAGGATCRVKLTSSLVSVAARFVAGPNPRPQPVRTKSIAAAGSYSAGGNGDYDGFSFFVSPGGISLLNISVDSGVTCSPAGSFPGSNQIVIPSVAIAPNGTFAGSATENGVFDNADAKFNYFFAGHLKGATSAGPPTAAGTLRQDIVFAANGTRETCTSNLQSWAATHDPQPAPARTVAVPGSYSAAGNSDYDGFSFFVSPGGANLLNVAIDAGLECTPAGSFARSNQIVIPNVAIAATGSFSGTATEHGVFDNANAEFTYSFAGYFEGATPAGPETLAGTLREGVVFAANGTTETCTSNLQPWLATHDPQPAPARTVAVPGSYSAAGNSDYDGFTFSVSSGSLTNISVDAGVECTPAGSFPGSNQIVIPNVAIAPHGSFSGTAIEHGVFDNANAKFTYSFAGYFEGATPAGTQTVAGTLREDIVFSANGTAEMCTSNLQPWSATRTS